jgi:hypothetical protein
MRSIIFVCYLMGIASAVPMLDLSAFPADFEKRLSVLSSSLRKAYYNREAQDVDLHLLDLSLDIDITIDLARGGL